MLMILKETARKEKFLTCKASKRYIHRPEVFTIFNSKFELEKSEVLGPTLDTRINKQLNVDN